MKNELDQKKKCLRNKVLSEKLTTNERMTDKSAFEKLLCHLAGGFKKAILTDSVNTVETKLHLSKHHNTI